MECPFCLENNNCAIDKNSAVKNSQPCWCFAVNVPNEMLQLIPKEKSVSVCVCQKCIAQYHQDKGEFIRRFAIDS
ncbi:cysteine-rich CWC family protein [Marinomonas transparens]